MHIQIPHQSSQKGAVERVKKGLIDARPHMKDQVVITKQDWDGPNLTFAFVAQGKEVTGKLKVTETEFIVDAKLPLMWRLFEGKIEKMIAQQANTMMQQ